MKITIEAFGDDAGSALAHAMRVIGMAIKAGELKDKDFLTCSCIDGGAELKVEKPKEFSGEN